MINLLTLIIFLNPLLPERLPAHHIFLGDHLPSIVGERSKCESLTGFCMTITLKEFLQVKDIVQNSPSLCEYAVQKSAEACSKQAQELAQVVQNKTITDQKVIDSLKVINENLELKLARTHEKKVRWKWASASLLSVSVLLTTTLIIIKK